MEKGYFSGSVDSTSPLFRATRHKGPHALLSTRQVGRHYETPQLPVWLVRFACGAESSTLGFLSQSARRALRYSNPWGAGALPACPQPAFLLLAAIRSQRHVTGSAPGDSTELGVIMTRREAQFLWVGLAFGFTFGVVATIIGLAHIYGLANAAHVVRYFHRNTPMFCKRCLDMGVRPTTKDRRESTQVDTGIILLNCWDFL